MTECHPLEEDVTNERAHLNWLTVTGSLAIVVALLTMACDRTITTLSPETLSVEVFADPSVYGPHDEFSGTFTFVNRSGERIRAAFPTTDLFHIQFFDGDGNLRRSYSPDRIPAVTYLDLAPFATLTDSVKFPLYSPPESLLPGPFLVRGWVDGHEDIHSETAITVR